MRHPHGLRAAAAAAGGSDIAVAHATSPYISVYPWSSGFGTKYANPATLPAGTGYAVTFSPDGANIAVAHISSPFISVYPWSSGFGTKYADPATLPTGGGVGVAFNPQ
jgi:hypothetical protein